MIRVLLHIVWRSSSCLVLLLFAHVPHLDQRESRIKVVCGLHEVIEGLHVQPPPNSVGMGVVTHCLIDLLKVAEFSICEASTAPPEVFLELLV
jgi:hypothetical protein